MKKIVLLLSVFALLFTSCGDDDTPPVDPIVGVWKYYKYFDNGVEIPLDSCESDSTLLFTSEGTFTSIYYFDNGTGCEIDEQTVGTWIGQGNLYTITANGVSDTELVTFENNTFYFDYTETFNGVTTTEREVYIKQ